MRCVDRMELESLSMNTHSESFTMDPVPAGRPGRGLSSQSVPRAAPRRSTSLRPRMLNMNQGASANWPRLGPDGVISSRGRVAQDDSPPLWNLYACGIETGTSRHFGPDCSSLLVSTEEDHLE